MKRTVGARRRGAVARQHDLMAKWEDRFLTRRRQQAEADREGVPLKDPVAVGKRPAPVIHFLPMPIRMDYQGCFGNHLSSAECHIRDGKTKHAS